MKDISKHEEHDDQENEKDEEIVETPKSEVVVETGRRKGRRAVSTGVISTN